MIMKAHTCWPKRINGPSPILSQSGKHARWWMRVYGRGVKNVKILYRAGKENRNADVLSHSPYLPAQEVGIAAVDSVTILLQPVIFLYSLKTQQLLELDSFASEQVRDPFVREVFNFMRSRQLPEDKVLACKIALQESLFTILDGILYYLDPKHSSRKQAVVPKQLQKQILEDAHSGLYGGHFCGRMYSSLMLHWWWERMFSDAIKFTNACPICAVTTGTGRKTKPSLHPIPMQRPFM